MSLQARERVRLLEVRVHGLELQIRHLNLVIQALAEKAEGADN